MDLNDDYCFKDSINRITSCRELCNLADSYMEHPTGNNTYDSAVFDFLKYCDTEITRLQQADDYDINTALQQKVRSLLSDFVSFFIEPKAPPTLFFCKNYFHDYISANNLNMDEIKTKFEKDPNNASPAIATETGFKPATKTSKRKFPIENPIPVNNKFQILDKIAENATGASMDHSNSENNTEGNSVAGDPKNKIHPFYIEIKGSWTDLANEIKKINVITPLIKLDGERLKIHCKNNDDFRKTQSYLDTNGVLYTTLSPKDKRPIKICIRGIPPYTDQALIIDALKEHGFFASSAAMLKSRKTGKPMPIYLANIAPRAKFEEVYQIKEMLNISVTTEKYRGSGAVKQCYRCQSHGHSSEICRFTPKCVKCALNHLTKDCPEKGKIKPTCANCLGPHPASYRGCPKNPQNSKKKLQNINSQKNHPKISSEIAEILDNYNYIKNKKPPPTSIPTSDKEANTASTSENNNGVTNAPNSTDASGTPNNNGVTIVPTSTSEQQNYISDFSDIFSTLKEIKEILNLNKLLKCFKNIALLTKKCKTPIEKMFIIINEFDRLSNEIDINNID